MDVVEDLEAALVEEALGGVVALGSLQTDVGEAGVAAEPAGHLQQLGADAATSVRLQHGHPGQPAALGLVPVPADADRADDDPAQAAQIGLVLFHVLWGDERQLEGRGRSQQRLVQLRHPEVVPLRRLVRVWDVADVALRGHRPHLVRRPDTCEDEHEEGGHQHEAEVARHAEHDEQDGFDGDQQLPEGLAEEGGREEGRDGAGGRLAGHGLDGQGITLLERSDTAQIAGQLRLAGYVHHSDAVLLVRGSHSSNSHLE